MLSFVIWFVIRPGGGGCCQATGNKSFDIGRDPDHGIGQLCVAGPYEFLHRCLGRSCVVRAVIPRKNLQQLFHLPGRHGPQPRTGGLITHPELVPALGGDAVQQVHAAGRIVECQ